MADRENCPMRLENGNCLPCGGFCTAVNDEICRALHDRVKLHDLIVDAENKFFREQPFFQDGLRVDRVTDYLIAHGVTVKQMQKPLTLEELHDVKAEAFLEVVDCPDIFHVPLPEFDDLGWIEFREVGGDKILFACDKRLYGMVWRCWASHPTYVERKAAEWLK